MPIGDLTSQLFSNVYLNLLDQYIKRELGYKYYRRYVDDFYIASKNKDFLKSIIPKIESFLKTSLKLDINKEKTKINYYKHGVEFLGAFIKPNRIYVSNSCLKRIKKQLYEIKYNKLMKSDVSESINSFLGIFSYFKAHNIKRKLFDGFDHLGYFNIIYTKFNKHEL